ncbi:copper resistance protein B [uncultured Parvibaculum sp.]|uniref:copper resistance protein B n=1 Tax=uncultured Parvibaculum sp. TaxID=291828 RepID=UPI0030D6FDF9|tara:strand:- start:42193 stop:42903 length:711 start_codon:yes stop_codon:yes gene_type:complete
MKKPPALALILAVGIASASHAQEPVPDDHGPDLFNMIKVEVDYADRHGGLWNGNLDGWIGGDVERLWIRAEGEIVDRDFEKAEAQLFYGRNVHPFWDLLVGVRQDFEPRGETYLATGIVGLAPYFFETEATAYLSTEGDLSARFEQSFDLPITQKLIAQPHVEVNVFAQDVPARGVGAGFSDIEVGLQLRYEIIRKFAPYLDLVWERKLGETASIARANGEDVEDTTLRFGVRAWF